MRREAWVEDAEGKTLDEITFQPVKVDALERKPFTLNRILCVTAGGRLRFLTLMLGRKAVKIRAGCSQPRRSITGLSSQFAVAKAVQIGSRQLAPERRARSFFTRVTCRGRRCPHISRRLAKLMGMPRAARGTKSSAAPRGDVGAGPFGAEERFCATRIARALPVFFSWPNRRRQSCKAKTR